VITTDDELAAHLAALPIGAAFRFQRDDPGWCWVKTGEDRYDYTPMRGVTE
jgi:hypothetical protein